MTRIQEAMKFFNLAAEIIKAHKIALINRYRLRAGLHI